MTIKEADLLCYTGKYWIATPFYRAALLYQALALPLDAETRADYERRLSALALTDAQLSMARGSSG